MDTLDREATLSKILWLLFLPRIWCARERKTAYWGANSFLLGEHNTDRQTRDPPKCPMRKLCGNLWKVYFKRPLWYCTHTPTDPSLSFSSFLTGSDGHEWGQFVFLLLFWYSSSLYYVTTLNPMISVLCKTNPQFSVMKMNIILCFDKPPNSEEWAATLHNKSALEKVKILERL